MNRMLLVIAVLSILSLGLAAGSQANSMAQSGFTAYNTKDLIGLTVKARDGVQLGRIFDLMVDSNGHVDFAIVGQPGVEDSPGRLVVVPYRTLMISKGKSDKINVVFNADE